VPFSPSKLFGGGRRGDGEHAAERGEEDIGPAVTQGRGLQAGIEQSAASASFNLRYFRQKRFPLFGPTRTFTRVIRFSPHRAQFFIW